MILVFISIFLFSISTIKAQVNFIWGKQIGTSEDEKARNLITDLSGNIYVFGKTRGKIGNEVFGKNDGFIVKIDSTANVIWATQIGTKDDDDIQKAVTDEIGNIYIMGYTNVVDEKTKHMDGNILVAKLNSDGKIVWQKHCGTDSADSGGGIVVSGNGDIYLTGTTKGCMANTPHGQEDCFILHLDNDGNQVNVVQFGTPANDGGYGIMIENNFKIYICGGTSGNLVKTNAGKTDIFLGIFTKDLETIKMMQHGTDEHDYAYGIKTDSKNNIYIAGSTEGNLGAKQTGAGDSFVQKLNEKGKIIWTKQFGTDRWDGTNGLDIFQDNKIIVSGCLNYPACQSFCKMYDADGNLLWNSNHVIQGEGGGTCGKGICVDSKGNIYHTGYTGANMFSELKGMHDIFLIKFKLD